jgi:hypothetical protein
MYIGIITFVKDTVEAVNIEAHSADEASSILATYVYNNYNKQVPMGGQYYVGVIIDPSILSTINTGSVPYSEPAVAVYC